MTENSYRQPNQAEQPTEQPQAEQKEEFDIQMELLEISEYDKETHKDAHNNIIVQFLNDEGNLIVVRNNLFTTIYDNQGKIIDRLYVEQQFLYDYLNRLHSKEKQIHINNLPPNPEMTINLGFLYLENLSIKEWEGHANDDSDVRFCLKHAMQFFPEYVHEDLKRISEFFRKGDKNAKSGDQWMDIEDAFFKGLRNLIDDGVVGFDTQQFEDLMKITKLISKNHFKDPRRNFVDKIPNIEQLKSFDIPSLHKSIGIIEGRIHILNWKNEDNPDTWELNEYSLPIESEIQGVGLDYNENFLLASTKDNLHVIDYRQIPPQIVYTLENLETEFHGLIHCNEDGSIVAGDKNGILRKILTNFSTFASHSEREDQKKLARRLKAVKRLKKTKGKSKKGGEVEKELTAEFKDLSTEMLQGFTADIDSATSSDDLHTIRQEADAMRREYAQFVTDRALLNNIVHPTFKIIAEKEAEIVTKEVEGQQGEIKNAVDRIDTMGIDELIAMSVRVGKLRGNVTSARVAEDVRKSVLALCDDFGDKSSDILKASESAMIEQLAKMVEKQKQTLAKMTKLSEFNEWLATDYPGLKEQITFRQKQAPASHANFMQHCLDTEMQLRELKDKYSKQFAEQYEEVRQQAVEKTDILGDIVEGRVEEFLEDLETQVQRGAFDTGEEAQHYAELSQLYQSASNSLDDLEENDSDRASHLRRRLKVKIAETVHMVKRMKSISVDEKSGKQVTTFGDETMEKWEHKVKKKHEVQTELSFRVDERSKGPGIKPADYMCELVLKVKDKSGKTLTIPFHEDDMRKYGLDNDRYYENSMSSSYLSIKEAKKIIKAVKEMNGRRNTDLKKQYQEFRGRIKDMNGEIIEAKKDWEDKWMGPRHAAETSGEAKWQQLFDERESLTKEYIQFIQKSGLYAWLKVKNVQNKYEGMKELFKNGQGFVPETKSHWTRDPQTEKYLEEFAKNAKLSLELRDGMISLEGHAGTGKDVLVEMFCAETNRPKFSFDCTKWTTEFELSQDVSLSAEGGASYTVKEDSIVVKALETPGAVLYFNEFNALPEQAQIFLHSLFDEKRQVTLKTSGGRVVKAHPTVIFCSSMNPGYRGTNDPQFATRSRMIPIKLKYPEFKMQDGTFGPSEALRMGRSISSLEDLTYDPDMQTNEFVNMWQNYINKSDEGMMTPEQKFDMEVIFSLLTFGNKLRDAFVKFVGKTGGPRDFKISQPFTGREMRRCAYVLSHMEASEKNNVSDAEEVAKNLIRRFYSQYIFNEKEADELEAQLKTWTTQKP